MLESYQLQVPDEDKLEDYNMADDNGSPIERVFRPVKKDTQITIDWNQMATAMGIEEEELTKGKRGQIQEILDNPTWSPSRKQREIDYVIGVRAKRGPKKPAKSQDQIIADRAAAYQKRKALRQSTKAGLGITSEVRERQSGLSPDERDDNRKAKNAARRKLTTRNKQVLTLMLPGFHEKYLGVNAEKRAGLMSGGVREDIKAAREAGVWDEMKIEIAIDALTNVGFTRPEATKMAKRKMGG